MLHEVLANLYGCPGCIFVENDNDSGIGLINGLDFLHPAEQVLLDRLCVLGTQYKKIKDFVELHLFNEKATGKIHGLYARAFANGLNEVLKLYRTDLWQLELEVLKDPHICLSHFLQLEKYLPLFQHLLETVDTLVRNRTHGCRILEVVYNASNCGIPMVEASMQRILKDCHVVLMSQIRHWMIRGILNDPFQEFFVCVDESSNVNKNIQSMSAERQNHQKYHLKPQLIPSYIPIQVAEKILFVGESIGIVETNKYPSYFEKHTPPSEFHKKEEEFTTKLLALGKGERFSVLQFTSLVAEIRAYAAEQMWKVIVEDSNLLAHLRTVKDFYLLGRGELYLIFIDMSNNCLKMPVTTTTLREAKRAFQTAALRASSDGDSTVERFHVILQEKKEDPQGIDKASLSKTKLETGWSTIGLIYEVPHALDTVFTPSVLDRYNVLFRFLLAVRRVQIELNQCFMSQMCNKKMERNSPSAIFWQLRAHMAFFIDNLQYYLQVDVLESQFSDLVHKVKTIKDFEAIKHAHQVFLTSITAQCFLHLKPVYFCLLDILDVCSSFCCFLSKIQDSVSSSDMTHFERLRLNFQRQTSLLFRLLCGIRSHQVSPHLTQLLLRIDYNKYLSTSGGHLGGPQVQNV